ncbi:MAG: molybdate ABC transporter permease subunit, partial [Gemmatimonadetes bacterium]
VRVALRVESDAAPPVVYVAAVPRAAERAAEAASFLAFLTSAEGQAVLSRYGFEAAAPPAGAAAGAAEPSPEPGPVRGGVPGEPRAAPSGPVATSGVDLGSAVRLSLVVALAAVLLGLVPAVAVGWLFARREFPGRTVLSLLVLGPLVLPPVVTGYLLLEVLGRQGLLGGALAVFGVSVPFTLLGAVVAAGVVGFPLYVMSIRGAFEAVDVRYEEVSWTLGVPPRRTFTRVVLPLALPGIAAGAVLAFARALGEFGATVVLAGNIEGETRTIALAVYALLEAPGGREAARGLVLASVVLSLLGLVGYEALSRRQRRRLERFGGE